MVERHEDERGAVTWTGTLLGRMRLRVRGVRMPIRCRVMVSAEERPARGHAAIHTRMAGLEPGILGDLLTAIYGVVVVICI